MDDNKIIDLVNVSTMRAAAVEYANYDALTAAESAALASIADLNVKSVLDIGVGGGRTVGALRALSENYIGVDYVQEMVDRSKSRFPDVRFEIADARAMPQFSDESFDLIVFSCNGICMVDHAGRMAILREVRRLLRPNGAFVFSTYNRNSPEHDGVFVFPEFKVSANPVKFVVRFMRFLSQTLSRIINRMRFKKFEVFNADYSILNDQCHHYRTFLYYITPETQLNQLQQSGFGSMVKIFDLSGKVASEKAVDDSLVFVARV